MSSADKLVVCAALDKCPSKLLSQAERQSLLRLNVGALSSNRALPGFVALYEGMPVILRMRNLSTDLGITNGSQGIVKKIVTGVCPNGFTYATCALVYFPYSKVELTGLPKGVFPILPVPWTLNTLLPDGDSMQQKLKITRHQLPIQPAFAVTGHSAQGKTLPKVLVNLHEGGFGAYVAASRARSRDGLCITETITLDQLNKPL
ncbi:hypothetical protein BV22DRAFT_1019909, partial [Leucogyrophana mollusca]